VGHKAGDDGHKSQVGEAGESGGESQGGMGATLGALALDASTGYPIRYCAAYCEGFLVFLRTGG
jgi:hypothetical protein